MYRKDTCPHTHTHTHTHTPTHARTHQLEWNLMPLVKAGDNIPKKHVCFEIRRGPRLYFRQRGDRHQQEIEKEQKYAHTLLTPLEVCFEEILISQ